MSTPTSSEFFDFFALPYLLREQIFANMCPSALIALYQSFSTAHTFFPHLTGKMCIRYSSRKPKILVIGSNGKRSILPFASSRTLQKIYSHLELVHISVEMNENSQPEDFYGLETLLNTYWNPKIGIIRIYSKDGKILDLDSLSGLFEKFQMAESIDLPKKIRNFPTISMSSDLVDISDGAHLNSDDVRRMCKRAQEVLIRSCRFSDSKFNDIIWDWLNGRNKCLRYLEISSRPRGSQELRVLMEDIPYVFSDGGIFEAKYLKKKVVFHTGFDIERQDGKRATVVRSAKKFKLIVWD
ncbi:unnamed protein product [Caenorhabditis brenneri]